MELERERNGLVERLKGVTRWQKFRDEAGQTAAVRSRVELANRSSI